MCCHKLYILLFNLKLVLHKFESAHLIANTKFSYTVQFLQKLISVQVSNYTGWQKSDSIPRVSTELTIWNYWAIADINIYTTTSQIWTFTLPHPSSPYKRGVQITTSNQDRTVTYSNKIKYCTSYSETLWSHSFFSAVKQFMYASFS
jgi:hypothetical protein